MTTNASVNPHWRARLLEIQDLVIVAREKEDLAFAVDDLSQAFLQLTAVLQEEWDAKRYPIGQLVTLVWEAYDVLTNPQSAVDLKDWVKAAEPFVK